MIGVIDPVTATIVLAAIAGTVAGEKGKSPMDGVNAGINTANCGKDMSLESSKDQQSS